MTRNEHLCRYLFITLRPTTMATFEQIPLGALHTGHFRSVQAAPIASKIDELPMCRGAVLYRLVPLRVGGE